MILMRWFVASRYVEFQIQYYLRVDLSLMA